MSTRDWGRWMEARKAGGKFTTEVMLVPGGALIRTRESTYNAGALSAALMFVPVTGPNDERTFLARLGCELPSQDEEEIPPAEPEEPRADADAALREAVIHLAFYVIRIEEGFAKDLGKDKAAGHTPRLRTLRERIRSAYALEDPVFERRITQDP